MDNFHKEQIINVAQCFSKCEQHGMPIISLNMEEDEDPFKCFICSRKQKLEFENHLLLVEIAQSNNETIFPNWPVNDDSVERDINIFLESEKNRNYVDEVNAFFKNLVSSVQSKITELQEIHLKKAQKLMQQKANYIKEYNEICMKERLKEIIKSNDTDLKQKKDEVVIIINEVSKSSDEIKTYLISLIEYMNKEQVQVNLENSNNIAIQIVESFNNIDIFNSQENKLERPKIVIPTPVKIEEPPAQIEAQNPDQVQENPE